MYPGPATKRPWTSVWRESDRVRDRRLRTSLAQRLGQYHHLNIDWARFDLPKLAIFVPANFDSYRMDQLGRSAVASPQAQTPDSRWWIKEMHPRTFVVPKTPEIKSTHMSTSTQWAYIIWFGGAVTLLALAGLLVIFTKLAEHIANHGFFNFRRRRSSEWERPTVRATAVPIHNIDPRTGGLTEMAITPPTPQLHLDSAFENELPPPYPSVINVDPRQTEEPPPPYSECCVAYSNSDERVHFYINQSINLPEDTVKREVNDTRQISGAERDADQIDNYERDGNQRDGNHRDINQRVVTNDSANSEPNEVMLPIEIQQNEHERLPIV